MFAGSNRSAKHVRQNQAALDRLFLRAYYAFNAENCAADFTRVTIIHILATPIIHVYHLS